MFGVNSESVRNEPTNDLVNDPIKRASNYRNSESITEPVSIP